MTLQEYSLLLLKRDGGCWICGTTNPGYGLHNLNVDHCHLTGRLRGLLCGKCNITLGQWRDNCDEMQREIKWLEAAIEYLKNEI